MLKKNLSILIIFLWFTIAFQSCTHKNIKSINYTQFVNSFIGTDAHGHTFPGATTPFGMIQLSPDNPVTGWDWASGYHWSSSTIAGFSHTHLSGTGVGDLLDISVLPLMDFNKNNIFKAENYYAKFSHSNEKASPGYYTVTLDNKIKVELTTTKRCGFHKYIFPTNKPAYLMFDLGFQQNRDHTDKTYLTKISNTEIEGYRFSKGWAKNQKVFFMLNFHTQ
jgi:putative alpha-1,2-mannosidase